MNNPLLIYGAGGFGREVLSFVKFLGTYDIAGFVDDQMRPGTNVGGYPVRGGVKFLNEYRDRIDVVIAVGSPESKLEIAGKISNSRVQFPSLVHPRAFLQDPASIRIGRGSIICAGAALTNDIVIGDFVLLNLNVTVGHDAKIGNHSSLMPGANIAGNVTLGSAVLIGAGANVMNNVVVGNRAKVGMGSVVLHNVNDNETVVGAPARSVIK